MSNYHPGMTYAEALKHDDETLGDWLIAQTWKRKTVVDGETLFWCSKSERFKSLAESVAGIRHSAQYQAIMGSRQDVAAMNRMGL